MDFGKIVPVTVAAVAALAVIITMPMVVEEVGPDELTVIQAPVDGSLTWYTQQGLKWQNFGTVTAFKKRGIYKFGPSSPQEECSEKTGGISIRFNDGGHGTVCGSIQYELPTSADTLTAIYQKFRSPQAVQHDIIETLTNNAIYMTGPLMSSKESYAEKRNDLIHYVLDQVQSGVYQTRKKTETTRDPLTGAERTVDTAEIILDARGEPRRQQESLLHRYGISASNFAIQRLPYDSVIEAQIKQQQQIAMDVQTQMAELIKAEQRARTVEQQGRADATKAKWDQETIKAKAVTLAEQEKAVAETEAAKRLIVQETDKKTAIIEAQKLKEVAETQGAQRLQVAELDRKAAEQTKLQQIALGEGEATRKKLVLDADGALELKAKTYVEAIDKVFSNLKGSQMVPSVVMGGQVGANQNALGLIDLLTAKTAKDLALDMNVSMPKK